MGREREMAEVERELARTRLLTLTGAGGSGKTQAGPGGGPRSVGAYPNGVWLVELAPLSEGALVPKAVAEALGVPERPGRPLDRHARRGLARTGSAPDPGQLRAPPGGCRPARGRAARLVPALRSWPPAARPWGGRRGEVARAPLSVPGRRARVLRSEEQPPSRCGSSSSGPGGGSVLLPEPENALAVAEICRQAGGHAAGHRARGGQGGHALRGADLGAARGLSGSPDARRPDGRAAGSGRSEATLDWSHDLLSEPEKILFGRLSVFAGGWTLEAAEAVASARVSRKARYWTCSPGWWRSPWWWPKSARGAGTLQDA